MAYLNVFVNDYIDIEVDIDDHLKEASTKELKKELSTRGVYFSGSKVKNDNNFKRELCDKYGVNYHTSIERLLTLIKRDL